MASPTRGWWVAPGTLRKEGPCAQEGAPSSEVMTIRRRNTFNLLNLLLGRPFRYPCLCPRVITSRATQTHVQGGEAMGATLGDFPGKPPPPPDDFTCTLTSCSLKTSQPSCMQVKKRKRERDGRNKVQTRH